MNDRKSQRRARVLALQALYAEEQHFRSSVPKVNVKSAVEEMDDSCERPTETNRKSPETFCDVLQFSWLDREPSAEELFMARVLVNGVRLHSVEIDEAIVRHLENWTLDRLLAVDRSILRLGAYMLSYLPDTPGRVIIDECVELCHNFSGEHSYRLVNGILHTLATKCRDFPSETGPDEVKEKTAEPEIS
ncbi:transcription antitermination factor NusB [Candidatus Haliotispira prima]|uniref:Transcription antitermination protein NusB n=1 Tax=Candidatus Haliotispira prima TaxID=3034016 RepID=A0ABY8MEJ6_9SPIO|nr:transcription antitermination factor NusB [Candidatus Haliotispira prima]